MPPSLLTFACPHCGGINQVPVAQACQVVPCAACRHPFRSDVPSGTLLAGQAASAPAAAAPSPMDAGDAVKLHPAALRLRFAATLFDAVLVLGGLSLVVWSALSIQDGGFWFDFFIVCGFLLWLVGVVNMAAPWLQSFSETLVVTPDATRLEKGFFKRSSIEIRHDRVVAMEVKQTLMERMLRIGTLEISSDGSAEDQIVMRGVPDPKAVEVAIRGRMQRR